MKKQRKNRMKSGKESEENGEKEHDSGQRSYFVPCRSAVLRPQLILVTDLPPKHFF